LFEYFKTLNLAPELGWAAPAGLIAAALLSLAVGSQTRALSGLDQIDQRLAQLPSRSPPTPSLKQDAAGQALARSLFGSPAGPIAPIVLQGIAITPARQAALLSIGDKLGWLAVGDSRNGVTLLDVQRSKITVDTAQGAQDISIGVKANSDAAMPRSTPSGSSTVPDPQAHRFHLPPAIRESGGG